MGEEQANKEKIYVKQEGMKLCTTFHSLLC